MKVTITCHIMPWEIDYALLTFTQLKKSMYHISNEWDIHIKSVLNLSRYKINWERSNLPKEFFIEKYTQISNILDGFNHSSHIYEGKEKWGHLELQREAISADSDYYMSICPDTYFSEYALGYMLESAKLVTNKFFVITPEIHKMWDHTWDEITNNMYKNVPYDLWDDNDIFLIRRNLKAADYDVYLEPTTKSKWAGWFDLYNKGFYEDLCPIHEDWSGYGPWDWYSLMLSEFAKANQVDFQQYVLRGQTIFEYSVGPLKKGLDYYYKNFLEFNPTIDERKAFETNMQQYLDKGVQMLKNKKIIP